MGSIILSIVLLLGFGAAASAQTIVTSYAGLQNASITNGPAQVIAYATLGDVAVPMYYTYSSSSRTIADQCTVQTSTLGAGRWLLQIPPGGNISVLNCGADRSGNSSTASATTSAIQVAITYACGQQNVNVLFDQGTYDVNAMLPVPCSNVYIVCTDPATSIINQISINTDTFTFSPPSAFSSITPASSSGVIGCGFNNMNSTNATGGAVIRMSRVAQGLVQNVRMSGNPFQGIVLAGAGQGTTLDNINMEFSGNSAPTAACTESTTRSSTYCSSAISLQQVLTVSNAATATQNTGTASQDPQSVFTATVTYNNGTNTATVPSCTGITYGMTIANSSFLHTGTYVSSAGCSSGTFTLSQAAISSGSGSSTFSNYYIAPANIIMSNITVNATQYTTRNIINVRSVTGLQANNLDITGGDGCQIEFFPEDAGTSQTDYHFNNGNLIGNGGLFSPSTEYGVCFNWNSNLSTYNQAAGNKGSFSNLKLNKYCQNAAYVSAGWTLGEPAGVTWENDTFTDAMQDGILILGQPTDMQFIGGHIFANGDAAFSGASFPTGAWTNCGKFNATSTQITTGPIQTGSANSTTASAGATQVTIAPAASLFNGTVTTASPTITAISSTVGLAIGESLSGTYIPSGATIQAISANGTSLTMSANSTLGMGSQNVSVTAIGRDPAIGDYVYMPGVPTGSAIGSAPSCSGSGTSRACMTTLVAAYCNVWACTAIQGLSSPAGNTAYMTPGLGSQVAVYGPMFAGINVQGGTLINITGMSIYSGTAFGIETAQNLNGFNSCSNIFGGQAAAATSAYSGSLPLQNYLLGHQSWYNDVICPGPTVPGITNPPYSLASASTLYVDPSESAVIVTGTTGISTIPADTTMATDAPSWQYQGRVNSKGRQITLIFNVANGASFGSSGNIHASPSFTGPGSSIGAQTSCILTADKIGTSYWFANCTN